MRLKHENVKVCLAYHSSQLYKKRKLEKRCLSCGRTRDLEGKNYCAACLAKQGKTYKNRISAGVCGRCGDKPLKTETRCSDCLLEGVSDRRELKQEVLNAYGKICACCGISQFEFLSIEHLNGDGGAHRKKIKRFGTMFYTWLKKNGFPKDLGLAVLCMNCNFSKGKYGYCPHRNLK